MSIPTRPRRRWVLDLEISADHIDALLSTLELLLEQIRAKRTPGFSVAGGFSASHTWELLENPHITHDSYIRELAAYDEALRSGRDEHGAA